MGTCSILDISCNLNNFTQWLYSFIAPYLDPILNLINTLINLIVDVVELIISLGTAIINIGSVIVTNIGGYFSTITAMDSTASAILTLIMGFVSIIIFTRVWNILADLELFGFKLPRIPM